MREPTGGADRAHPDASFSVLDVERAAARIAGRVHRTPVLTSRLLDRELGRRLALKAEHLQRVGAFKARGAFNALLALSPARRAAGVLAADTDPGRVRLVFSYEVSAGDAEGAAKAVVAAAG